MSWFGRSNYYNNAHSDVNKSVFKNFTTESLLDLAQEGANFLRNPNISVQSADSWMDYSEKIVELTTKRYDVNIYLSYLRMLLSIRHDKNFGAYQKVKTCVDYLLAVIETLNK